MKIERERSRKRKINTKRERDREREMESEILTKLMTCTFLRTQTFPPEFPRNKVSIKKYEIIVDLVLMEKQISLFLFHGNKALY